MFDKETGQVLFGGLAMHALVLTVANEACQVLEHAVFEIIEEGRLKERLHGARDVVHDSLLKRHGMVEVCVGHHGCRMAWLQATAKEGTANELKLLQKQLVGQRHDLDEEVNILVMRSIHIGPR